jgi:hypothetical protein
MTNTNECLEQAMYAASESYSVSTYKTDLLKNTGGCSEGFIHSPTDDATYVPTLAA